MHSFNLSFANLITYITDNTLKFKAFETMLFIINLMKKYNVQNKTRIKLLLKYTWYPHRPKVGLVAFCMDHSLLLYVYFLNEKYRLLDNCVVRLIDLWIDGLMDIWLDKQINP